MNYHQKYYQENKDRLREAERRRKYTSRYGISYDDFIFIVESQNGRCKICDREVKLHLDHCHSTGKVRGALCFQCNNGLGSFKDDLNRLKKAQLYLEWFQ